jgi:hypothetical protein
MLELPYGLLLITFSKVTRAQSLSRTGYAYDLSGVAIFAEMPSKANPSKQFCND